MAESTTTRRCKVVFLQKEYIDAAIAAAGHGSSALHCRRPSVSSSLPSPDHVCIGLPRCNILSIRHLFSAQVSGPNTISLNTSSRLAVSLGVRRADGVGFHHIGGVAHGDGVRQRLHTLGQSERRMPAGSTRSESVHVWLVPHEAEVASAREMIELLPCSEEEHRVGSNRKHSQFLGSWVFLTRLQK